MNLTRRTASAPRASIVSDARYEVFEYRYNDNSRHFERTTDSDRMPSWLRLDPVHDTTKYRNITHFLCSQQIGYKKAVNSGLQGVGRVGCYAADMLANGCKSLLAVRFNEDRSTMQVFVFWNFWKERTAHRLDFVKNFLITH
jgi:hypothetical protein